MIRHTGATEDIVSEAILRAIERVEEVRPEKFIPWLTSIAINMARHWIRSQKTLDTVLERRGSRNSRSALSEAMTEEAFGLFEKALHGLTWQQQYVFLHRIVRHESMAEIASHLRLRPGAVRALLHRARLKLAAWYEYMRPAAET